MYRLLADILFEELKFGLNGEYVQWDNDNENISFDHNIQIEITIWELST